MQMKPSVIKQRLQADLPSIVFSPTPSPTTYFVEMAALAGYHGIWIDHEHQNYTDQEMAAMCVACRAGGVDGMFRVRRRDNGSYFRALEIGAHGIMLPHCNGPQDAADCVRQVKFPPEGNRSIDGIEPHSCFAWVPMEDYLRRANEQSFVVVQIEEPPAVERVEEIAAVEGVDVLFVGPGDLGVRYGDRPDPGAAVEEAVVRVAEACRRHGKHWGITAGSRDILKRRIDQGARLVAYGSVFFFVYENLRRVQGELEELLR